MDPVPTIRKYQMRWCGNLQNIYPRSSGKLPRKGPVIIYHLGGSRGFWGESHGFLKNEGGGGGGISCN